MMGRRATGREQLFYTFSMEDHVPADHLLRGIHQFLDLSNRNSCVFPQLRSTAKMLLRWELVAKPTKMFYST